MYRRHLCHELAHAAKHGVYALVLLAVALVIATGVVMAVFNWPDVDAIEFHNSTGVALEAHR